MFGWRHSNDGNVNPLDVLAGAVGGAASPGGGRGKPGGYTGATADGRPGLGGYDSGDGFIYPEKPDGNSHELYQTTEPSGSLKLWPHYGIEGPAVPILPDLSNLDEVVEAAKRGLGL
ncbi:hypothetical protein P3T37_004615 [Kitasatospora sp. MAA4]|uniref:hypothetical protein n=1 Tax=Kitasatospora sp. MAA4 TaxID=3035093 RepID=UPI002474A11B|nr:hypothetical protein [Kitasatospora sp. MAA4]MDH6135205.1 hypothetical protein [Kitasatospora sp. MAA4]